MGPAVCWPVNLEGPRLVRLVQLESEASGILGLVCFVGIGLHVDERIFGLVLPFGVLARRGLNLFLFLLRQNLPLFFDLILDGLEVDGHEDSLVFFRI